MKVPLLDLKLQYQSLKEELDAAAERHAEVQYDPQLIDATYALLLETSCEAMVIPALNRDGATLSDLLWTKLLIMLLVNRTTLGFELRMVGLNPTAARYSGINVKRITVLTMVIAGALAGMAGAMQTLGVNHRYEQNQSLGLGFDAITVALLGANNPIGVVVAAFGFGAMDAGATRMQFNSGVPSEIIIVIQALILMFVAAEQIIRMVYRIRGEGGLGQSLSTGWGQR